MSRLIFRPGIFYSYLLCPPGSLGCDLGEETSIDDSNFGPLRDLKCGPEAREGEKGEMFPLKCKIDFAVFFFLAPNLSSSSSSSSLTAAC